MTRSQCLRLMLAMLMLPAAALGTTPDDLDLSGRDDRNLRPLLELLRNPDDGLPGELGEVAERLRGAASVAAARRLLRDLLPELARHRALRQRRGRWVGHSRPGTHRRPDRSYRVVTGLLRGEPLRLASVEPERFTTVWLQGSWDNADQDDRDGVDGFDSDARGILLGLEREIRPGFSLGIAGGRTNAEITTPGRGRDDTDADDYLAFSSLNAGAHRFDFLLSARVGETDRRRIVRIPRNGEVRLVRLLSTVDTEELLVSASWSRDFELSGGWYVSPGLDLGHMRRSTDDYVESGGGELGLAVETEDEAQTLAGATLGVGYFALADAWAISPGASLNIEHALAADETVTTSTFTRTRFSFTSRGYSVEKTRFTAGLQLAAYHQSGFGGSLGVVHERQDDYRYTATTLTLEVTF